MYFQYCIGWLYFVMATVMMISLGNKFGTDEVTTNGVINLIGKTLFCSALYGHWYLTLKALEIKSE